MSVSLWRAPLFEHITVFLAAEPDSPEHQNVKKKNTAHANRYKTIYILSTQLLIQNIICSSYLFLFIFLNGDDINEMNIFLTNTRVFITFIIEYFSILSPTAFM